MKNHFYKFSISLIYLFCSIGSLSLIYSQDKVFEDEKDRNRTITENSVQHEYKYEDTESTTGTKFFKRREKETRPAWVEALHEARLNGDEKLMRKLERENISPLKTVGESIGDYTTESSGTVGFPGEPKLEGSSSGSLQDWGTDIHVRSSNTDFRESYPAMATSSDGTIYVVWENFGSTQPYAYLQIYYSTDGGDNWTSYGWISNASYDLSQPSLAIGEGNENYLIMAWVVDDSVSHIEVGYTPLINVGYSLTQVTPPYLTFWAGYQKPVIWTDSYDWSAWYIYLTAEAEYITGSNNFNVVFWRSTDYGVSFSDPHETLYGNFDSYAWLDPDGTYGCIGNDIYVAVFNASDSLLYVISSLDYGATWGTESSIHMVDPLPSHAVDPDIEAAVNYDNIMICCTKSYNSADNIAQCYSTDAGVTWSAFYSLDGYTSTNEFAAELTANEGGNSWHVTYTDQDHWLSYNTRPQDLSTYWQLTPDVVNDVAWATAVYTKKAITSNWVTDAPGIAWSDYRDGPGDYDIYFDKSLGTSTFPLTVSVADGWNMVSVPGLHPTNQNVTTWWSNLTGSVFKYSAGYTPVTTTATTEGYWMKNSGAQVYNYPAIQIVTHYDINAAADWNMIGGYENTVTVGNLYTTPPGLIAGTIYEYSGGYNPATDIVPGYGYWVKMSAAGLIGGLGAPPLSKSSIEAVEYFKEDWGKIIITDNAGRSYTLYAVNGEVNLGNYELPPMPPSGMFDIRYNSDRIAEDINSSIQSIEMSGVEYPVRVTVENMSITLQDESGTRINAELKPGEELEINNISINKLLVLSGEIVAPIEYALEQNYPNPFNPSTKIKYAIPQSSQIILKVFDVLGNEIATLLNEEKQAGSYEVEFNATA
ncbi:MAG: hypothetical protein DRQ13_06925, partial [Ignavibacteriae bacterium]